MSLIDLTTQALELDLQGTSARSRALATDVANADTPGFKMQDVNFHDALAQAVSAIGTSGNPGGSLQLAPGAFDATVDSSAAVSADGNSVNVSQTNTEVAENALEQNTASALLRSYTQQLMDVTKGMPQ
jgi:flagellar basal-body rod protein FlgB